MSREKIVNLVFTLNEKVEEKYKEETNKLVENFINELEKEG